MILARCPACATTFRVRPEQLRARQGRVRCGRCQHAFNALETLVDDPAAAQAVATSGVHPEDEAPVFVLEDKPDALAEPGSGTDIRDAAQAPTEAQPDDAPSVRIDPVFDPDSPLSDAEFDDRNEPAGEIILPERRQDEDDAPPPLPLNEPEAARDAPLPEPPASPPHSTEPEFQPLLARSAAPEQDIETLEDAPSADQPPPDVRDREGLDQMLWAAAATVLALLLLAQGVLVFRNEIAQSSPEARKLMQGVCAGMGCELPLPRDASLIGIEGSDIRPDASREAYFTLQATLRNRADFEQAYPHLEITLTDARDRALVRRVLEPRQWLPAEAAKDAFAAHGELAARIGFEAPAVAAAGYRVYAFYP